MSHALLADSLSVCLGEGIGWCVSVEQRLALALVYGPEGS